jgi:hypothetical protein
VPANLAELSVTYNLLEYQLSGVVAPPYIDIWLSIRDSDEMRIMRE